MSLMTLAQLAVEPNKLPAWMLILIIPSIVELTRSATGEGIRVRHKLVDWRKNGMSDWEHYWGYRAFFHTEPFRAGLVILGHFSIIGIVGWLVLVGNTP